MNKKIALIIPCLLFLLSSCQPLPVEEGIPFIRRPNWWNFYHRGIAYSKKGRWADAATDFETALGKQKGAIYPEINEKRRAKTYGLHFLNDYFPHRELGICYYQQGFNALAEKELSTSIGMVSSSRAKSYLNKVRHAQFMQLKDETPDSIKFDINLPDDVELLNQPLLNVAGNITSPYHIEKVSVKHKPLFVELAEMTFAFDQKIRLSPGAQTLVIEASDLAGNRAKWEKSLIVDLDGPTISFTPNSSQPKEYIDVIIRDNHELKAIRVDEKNIDLPASKKKSFRIEIPLKPKRNIKIKATDKVGNETIVQSQVEGLMKASIESRKLNPDTRQASAPRKQAWPGVISDVQLVSADVSLPKKLDDTIPPKMQLFPNIENQVSVTTELYVLDLEVSDSGFVDTVTVALNDQSQTRRLGDEKLIKYRFTQTFELQPENNTLSIKIRDKAGNEKKQSFTILRKLDYRWREDLRVTAQVLPPEKSAISKVKDIDIYSLFVESLLFNPKRLNIIERDPETMQRILMEFKLAESSLADKLKAIKTGKLKTSDWLLKEHLTEWSGEANWDLVISIIDVSTSEYILTTDIHFNGYDSDHVEFQLRGLVDKIHQQLPTASAIIDKKMSSGMKIGLGKRDNIIPGMKLVFISSDEEDIDFADPIMWKEQWVQGKVKRVKDNACLIEIIPKEAIDSLNVNDLAIIR